MVSAGDPQTLTAHRKHHSKELGHRSGRYDRSSHSDLTVIGDPYFAEGDSGAVGVNNVTAQLGLTTYLHCKVNNLNGKTVSYTLHI